MMHLLARAPSTHLQLVAHCHRPTLHCGMLAKPNPPKTLLLGNGPGGAEPVPPTSARPGPTRTYPAVLSMNFAFKVTLLGHRHFPTSQQFNSLILFRMKSSYNV